MSSYADIHAQLLESGELFEDGEFPAEDKSLFYAEPEASWTNLEWKRPKEICENAKFHVEGASRFDLAQGDLGNCWFLSAATTLATQSDLFEKVAPTNQSFDDNYAGIFRFNFWRYGRWVEVVIDDRLPVKNNKLVFCYNRTNGEEFWGALLEKAYAKVHGSYQSLESGYSHDALVDFTGGIGEFIDLVKEQDGEKRIYRTLRKSFKMNSLLCAAIEVTEGGSYEETLDNGLVAGHAYSITNIAEIKVDGKKERLVRLRNPWGRKEWTGRWADGSDVWEKVTDEQRERLDLRVVDDGEFWMPFEDFMKNFHTAQICHLTPDSVGGQRGKNEWNVSAYHGSWIAGVTAGGCGLPPSEHEYWMNPQYMVKVSDPDITDESDTCTLVISLIQKYRRMRKTIEKNTSDTEEPIAFDILRFNGDEPEELGESNCDESALRMERKMTTYEFLRERCGRYSLTPGVYGIIPCTYAPDTEGEFILRLATETPTQSIELGTTRSSKTKPGRAKREKPSRFERLFEKHAGEDGVICARELQRMLNKGVKREADEEFSRDTCRSLISWARYPEKGGKLDHNECQKAWDEANRLSRTFIEFDADESGTLNRKELRKSLKAIGLSLGKSTLASVVQHFCGKDAGLSMDEFVQIATKTSTSIERYEALKDTNISLDEFLESTLLT